MQRHRQQEQLRHGQFQAREGSPIFQIIDQRLLLPFTSKAFHQTLPQLVRPDIDRQLELFADMPRQNQEELHGIRCKRLALAHFDFFEHRHFPT